MKMSRLNVSTENPEMSRLIAKSPNWTSTELFIGEPQGHKFKPGDVCELVGLKHFPEHNGEKVTITAIRVNGANGERAYYVKGDINEAMNWVYEYRLKSTVKC